MAEDEPRELTPADPPRKDDNDDEQPDLFPETLMGRYLEVERERIDSYNRRTDVARLAVEAGDASDKRQFEYYMERLRTDERRDERRHGLARRMIVGGGVAAIVVLSFLMIMAFYGNEQQQATSITWLKILATGAAGWGIVNGIITVLRRLLKSRDD